jgi:hypothetical protein
MEGMEKQLTAVEWLVEQICGDHTEQWQKEIEQAKQMEKDIAEEYAEFCIRCDRANLPIIKFEDWIKELTFKSE